MDLFIQDYDRIPVRERIFPLNKKSLFIPLGFNILLQLIKPRPTQIERLAIFS